MRTAQWLGRAHRRVRAAGGASTWVAPRATTLFFILAFLVFTTVEPYLAQINNPNENTRTYLTMAIVEHHTFRLDQIVERHGWIGDLGRVPENAGTPSERTEGLAGYMVRPGQLNDGPVKNHYVSVKGPATSYFGVPFYWAFTKIAPHFGHPVPTAASPPLERAWWLRTSTFVLRLFAVQLPSFFFLVWFERWLRRTTDDVVLRLSAVAAVAFGSNFLGYSLMFVSHAASAAAAFASFGLTLQARLDSAGDARRRRVSTAFFAGLFAAMVPLLEYSGLPVALVLALYGLTTFWRPKGLLAFVAGALVDVAGLTFYQARACGTWRTPCPKYAEGFAWLHTKTFGFGKPDLTFLREASLSHSFGFFGMSPFMWLGLLAIPFGLFLTYGSALEKRERRLASWIWIVAMAALWFFVSAASNPHGGWSIGPRYLGPAPPFFAFGAALALERIAGRSRARRILVRAAAGGLALASAVEIGLVSLIYNSLPESTARPLATLAIPLAWAGFVPYHVGELFGWMSPTWWYIVAGCLLGATLLAATWPQTETSWSWTLRFAGVLLFFTLGLRPAFGKPGPLERTDASTTAWFSNIWEPAGRDRLHKLRAVAEKDGPVHPCLWWKLASVETNLGLTPEATRDGKRAKIPRSECH